ncbi:MAG TPA: hypothetical protein VJ694_00290 [Patescibacteria group bacterium]|nr:hypothetical protein [Patescibacteria group bacterium]
MHILKREVSSPRSSSALRLLVLAAACVIFLSGNVVGFYRGLQVGSEPSFLTEDVQDGGACGISDPIACVRSLAESVADLFRPAPEIIVTATPFRAVVCADAERAYWACAHDADCPIETFEAIADDVNFCQSPPRR